MDPRFLSSRLCLDYVGTLRWRRSAESLDYLTQPSDLVEWATTSGIIDEPFRVTTAKLATALEVREVIYKLISGGIKGVAPNGSDVVALNAAAERLPVAISLGTDGSVGRVGSVDQFLSTMARDALDLLGSDQIGLVRECDGPECTRIYIDNSRAGKRRWCSNAVCGNQAKVSAFRRRAHAQTDDKS
jgi:predicted RNA-binding Zn ribbon-like protein